MRRAALLIAAAFAAVYLIWGSTYLAIKFAVETMPPFLMASARWLLAGGALYAWTRARGAPAPTLAHWRTATIVGALLVLGGNGVVSWSQQFVPSALTALLIAVVPVWIALLLWQRTKKAPSGHVALGIALGLAGVAVLVVPAVVAGIGGARSVLLGTVLILLAAFSWANGSLYSRGAPQPANILQGAAMQMVAGGVLLGIVGLALGEAARVDLAHVSARSWLAFGFLAFFGSIVAYSAYVWLLREVRAELVATYAFVNPIVAVILGALLAGEGLTTGIVVAAALIVVGVALVVTGARRAAPPAPPSAPAPE